MHVNVGHNEQIARGIFGPALLIAGYEWLGGKVGKVGGILAMIGGAVVTGTAITRTCPMNALLGIDTAH